MARIGICDLSSLTAVVPWQRLLQVLPNFPITLPVADSSAYDGENLSERRLYLASERSEW